MTKSGPITGVNFSEDVVTALQGMLDNAPECAAEVAAVTEFGNAVAAVRERRASSHERRLEIASRLGRAKTDLRKLTLRKELGEPVGDEMAAAQSELDSASRAGEAAENEDEALAELLEERIVRLEAAVTALKSKSDPWRAAVYRMAEEIADESRRAASAAQAAMVLFGSHFDPPIDYLSKRKGKPVLQHEPRGELLLTTLRRGIFYIQRRVMK